ncbi:hypothetical protein [Mesobacillus sp.]|uniref:hypothetical protein n=1 Tax=Mesobacillus sp. TaxID=2675271 RepID=UPI0039EF37F1
MTWIAFASGLLFLNRLLYPNYISNNVSLLIALFCFTNAAALFTALTGINKKVITSENNSWKKTVLEAHKDEFQMIQKQILFDRAIEPIKSREDKLLTEFKERMEKAKDSWRLQAKNAYSSFEVYFCLENRLKIIFFVSRALSFLLSVGTGFMVLNITEIHSIFFSIYGLLLLLMLIVSYYQYTITKNFKRVKEEIYPNLYGDYKRSV